MGQDRDTTVVKLKLMRLYVRFDGAFCAAHPPVVGPGKFLFINARVCSVLRASYVLYVHPTNPIKTFY